MVKKIFRILIVAVLVAAIVFGVYIIKKYNTPVQPVLRFVPLNSAFFTKAKSLTKLRETLEEKTEYWENLLSINAIDKLNNELSFIDSVVRNNEKLADFVEGSTVINSAHKTGDEIRYLHLVNLKNAIEADNAQKYFNNYLASLGQIETRKYNRERIYNFKKDDFSLFYAFVNGIFVASYNSILIEEAIRQSDAEHSIMDQHGFRNVSETEGKFSDVNLFINLNKIPQVIKEFVPNDYSNILDDFATLGNWIELDVNLKEEGALLNGFTSVDKEKFNYFNIFINQEPVKFQAIKIIPKDAPSFVRFGVSDFAQFRSDYKKYEKEIGNKKNFKGLENIRNSYGKDLEQSFIKFFNNEFLLVYSTLLSKENNNDAFCIVGTKSKSVAENELVEVLKTHAKNKNINFNSLYSNYKIDDDIVYKLYKFPVNNICSLLFGRLFNGVKSNYFTFIDNYLVFAENKDVLRNIIRENIIGNALSFDVNFNTLTNNLSAKSNFLLYSNIPRSNNIITNNLNDITQKDFEKNKETINKFHSIGYQFLSNGEMIYNNIYVQYNPVKQKKATTLWESKIDEKFDFKPVIVRNHYTNEKEVFLQDISNAIYLVSKSGRVLWKQRLNEQINSEVFQIDFYKNGKLQLLFSTKNYLHCIDRNGNYVDKYPVKLKSPATAGLALFDYAKNKDYRIFIPCSDKRIYLYDVRGKIKTGWKFGKTESIVEKPIQYFNANNKDYIVFSDSLKVYILNRKGETRVRLSEPVSISKNNILYLEKRGNFRMVSTTTKGEIVYIYFSGTIDKKKTIELTSDHYFDYKDVDGDYVKDKIFVDKNKLIVLGDDDKEIINHAFNENINKKPIYFLFPGHEGKIGVTSNLDKEIYLFNKDGSLYNGFPLLGSTSFSISRLSSKDNFLYLLVGDGNGFLMNYQLK
jgi:Protein of unknown function (DUF3352)